MIDAATHILKGLTALGTTSALPLGETPKMKLPVDKDPTFFRIIGFIWFSYFTNGDDP